MMDRQASVHWGGRVLGGIALLGIAFQIYGRALGYEMIFDDIPAIVGNESIHHLRPLWGSTGEPGPLVPKLGTPLTARPMVNLSMAISYHFSHTDPFGYRLSHISLHVLSTITLWLILAATLSQPALGGRFIKYRWWLAFLSAMLWMVHPVHTETVVYLTQRTELQMGAMYLLTLYFAILFWGSTGRVTRASCCLAATVTSVSGMLSKEMMASVPAMVLAYEWTFVSGNLRAIVRRSWPLYLGLIVSWLSLTVFLLNGYQTPAAGFNNTISAPHYWLTESNAFFVYWRLVFYPWPLLIHYDVPTLTRFTDAWPGVAGVLLYVITTGWLVRRRHPIGFCLLWFFATLSPTLIVPLPHEEISERRLYVSLAAIAPAVTMLLWMLSHHGAGKLRRWLYQASPAKKEEEISCSTFLWGQSLTILCIMICSVVGAASLPRLKNRRTIWLEVLKHHPSDWFALASQGTNDFLYGNQEKGLARMRRAFEIKPDSSYTASNYIAALNHLRQFDLLVDVSRSVYEFYPESIEALIGLAAATDKANQPEESIRLYQQAIQQDPECWFAHSGLAAVLAKQNRITESIKHFEAAARIEPDFLNYKNLMQVYLRTHQYKKASYAAKELMVAARAEGKTEIAEQIEKSLQALKRQSAW